MPESRIPKLRTLGNSLQSQAQTATFVPACNLASKRSKSGAAYHAQHARVPVARNPVDGNSQFGDPVKRTPPWM